MTDEMMKKVEKVQFVINSWTASAVAKDETEALSALLTDHARLDAIVEKLPKTADGVILEEGMTLYKPWFLCKNDSRGPEGTIQFHKSTVCWGQNTGDYYDPSEITDSTKYYSTKAAALAAKEKNENR